MPITVACILGLMLIVVVSLCRTSASADRRIERDDREIEQLQASGVEIVAGQSPPNKEDY
jgi:hypothetical protein